MNEQTPEFTVFTADCYQGNNYEKYRGLSLEAFIETLMQEFPSIMNTPVAWAPELLDLDGTKTVNEFRAESIAAGRVIKLIDGKYVAFGQHGECPGCALCNPIAPTFYCAAETIKPYNPHNVAAPVEPKRARLTWADSKPFDAFDGFKVKRDTATPDHAYSHPLTRVADAGAQTNPKNGSAWLVVR